MLAVVGFLLVGAGCDVTQRGNVGVMNKDKENKGAMMENKGEESAEFEADGVMMDKGTMMVVSKTGDTMTMNKEITMQDGTKVMTDGKVLMKDGSVVMMKEGEKMMMQDGQMMMQKTMVKENGLGTGANVTVNSNVAMEKRKGSYEAYEASKLSLAEKGKVVLFFHAGWCPTCKAADADIKANLSKIPDGVTILKVDYDSSTELKKKYGVTYQHTFVQVDASGNMLKKWSGSSSLAEIAAQVQ